VCAARTGRAEDGGRWRTGRVEGSPAVTRNKLWGSPPPVPPPLHPHAGRHPETRGRSAAPPGRGEGERGGGRGQTGGLSCVVDVRLAARRST